MAKKKLFPLTLTLFIMLFAVMAFSAAAVTLGDVDGDKAVSAADARLCLRRAVDLETYTQDSREFKACDVNNDGSVTAGDARYILRASIHLEDINELHTHILSDWAHETDAQGNGLPYHIKVCSVCDKIVREDCDLGEKTFFTELTAPNCTEGTEYEQTCAVCAGVTRTVEPPLGHDTTVVDQKTVSCTEAGYVVYACNRCGKTGYDADAPELRTDTPALGHIPSAAAIMLETDVVCTRCGDVLIPSFNNTLNALKDGNNRFKSFEKTTNNGNIDTFNLKISAAAKAAALLAGETIDENQIRSEFENELAANTVTYTMNGMTQRITNDNFPLKGTALVSELTAADIKSITSERMTGVDFVSTLPDELPVTYPSGAVLNYPISSIKNAVIGDVDKVTVTLKEERYSRYKNSTAKTALQKIADMDVRELAASFENPEGVSDTGDGFTLDMTCNELTTNAAIIYYLDAETHQPIAAHYDVRMVCNQGIVLSAAIERINLMNGNMTMTLNNNVDTYFFFNGNFD